MKRLVSILAILLVSVPALAGCDSTTSFENATLEDTEWVMESYGEAGNLKAARLFTEVTLHFDSAEGEFGGYTGINYYGGKYQLNGSELSFPEGVFITCLGGNAVVQQQETDYIRLFGAADSFEIVDGKLHIYSNGNEIVYRG